MHESFKQSVEVLQRVEIFNRNRLPELDPTRNGPVLFGFGYGYIIRWVIASNIRGYRVGSGYYPKPDRVPI